MVKLRYLNDFRFLLALLIFVLISVLIYRRVTNIEPFQNSVEYKNDSAYQSQVKLLSDNYDSLANGKRPVTELLNNTNDMCLVNDEILMNNSYINYYEYMYVLFKIIMIYKIIKWKMMLILIMI
jgi:hypothetical protein